MAIVEVRQISKKDQGRNEGNNQELFLLEGFHGCT